MVQVESYQRLKKMVLNATLRNTQHYKVSIKVKWSNPVNGVVPSPPLHLGVVAIEKGAFEWPSTKVANFTYFYLNIQLEHTDPGIYKVRDSFGKDPHVVCSTQFKKGLVTVVYILLSIEHHTISETSACNRSGSSEDDKW